jgi:RNA polymerase sigma-70 factor (ECF subfamily)
MERQELCQLLAKALGTLSPEQRAVVELTFYHGFSYPEIAAIVDCPVNTVKTRMFHARKRLGQLVSELGPYQDEL